MYRVVLLLSLVVLQGCMPNRPVASKITTGPVPTIKAATAVLTKPREVLERAITARGGEAALKKLKAVSYQGKGKSAPSGIVSTFVFRTMSALPDRTRDESDYADGTKFVQVLHRDKGWVSINGKVKEMEPPSLRSMQESLYASHLLTLLPLREERFTLEPLPEQRKEGVIVQGMVVKCKDQREVTLFFEKENGLLLLSKAKVFDANLYTEREQETFFTRYAAVQGVQFPMRWVIYNDGNKSMELNFDELKFIDKVDDILFAKP